MPYGSTELHALASKPHISHRREYEERGDDDTHQQFRELVHIPEEVTPADERNETQK